MKARHLAGVAALGLLCGQVNAKVVSPAHETGYVITVEEWILVQEQHGIKAYVMTHQEGETSYLKIKFENPSNSPKDISWSLSKKGEVIFNDQHNRIQAQSAIEIYDATMLVPVGAGASLTDFSVTIH